MPEALQVFFRLPLVATVAPIVTAFQCRTHWAAKQGFAEKNQEEGGDSF